MRTENNPTIIRRHALAGGALFFALTLAACGSGGGSQPGSSAAAPGAGSGTQTQSLVLYHGKGWVCTFRAAGTKLYCWASEAAALTNGDAAALGLTSTTPQLMVTNLAAFPIIGLYDTGIRLSGSSVGLDVFGVPAGSQANSYQETVTCDEVTAESVTNCPEAVSDLTFARIEHSPTWKLVRRVCSVSPHKSEDAGGRGGSLFSGGAV